MSAMIWPPPMVGQQDLITSDFGAVESAHRKNRQKKEPSAVGNNLGATGSDNLLEKAPKA